MVNPEDHKASGMDRKKNLPADNRHSYNSKETKHYTLECQTEPINYKPNNTEK